MSRKDHQREVCEAVIRLMEARKGESLTVVGAPDESDRSRKAVDLHIRSTRQEYHVEHTLVESFPGQIADGCRIMDLLAPLEKSLEGMLPKGHFTLTVASGATAGATDIGRIQTALERWVLEKAPLLSVQALKRNTYERYRGVPEDVPFEVVLSCDPRLDDRFYIYRFAPAEIEGLRRERIRVALDSKCPKLQDAKVRLSSCSVLILESNDIALANHSLIAQAFACEVDKRTNDIPDEAYLVETDIRPWVVWVLKEGCERLPNVPDAGPHYVQALTSSSQ